MQEIREATYSAADLPGPRRCETCRGETTMKLAGPFTGDDRDLTLTLQGLPVLECANGHRQFVHPDFALQLLAHLTEEDEAKLPAASTKGVLFKHFLCTDCGTELQAKTDHAHTFSVDVALPAAPPFHIDLTMPVYHCTACGKDQLHSIKDVRTRTPRALMQAFKAGGLAHA
jgi:hypothetical protein